MYFLILFYFDIFQFACFQVCFNEARNTISPRAFSDAFALYAQEICFIRSNSMIRRDWLPENGTLHCRANLIMKGHHLTLILMLINTQAHLVISIRFSDPSSANHRQSFPIPLFLDNLPFVHGHPRHYY